VTDPKRVVEAGYDAIAERYLAWGGEEPSPTRRWALGWLLGRLEPASDVLELGCGAGVPVTRALAVDHRVTGADISARQVALARQNVPHATFVHGDLASLVFPDASFDAVVAFYALTHVPREQHAPLLGRIARWLRPNGLFFATMGAGDDPGTVDDDWLGAPMYFSHFGAEANVRLVESAGLAVELAEVREEDEDGAPVRFLWIAARKRAVGATTPPERTAEPVAEA
jgi:SAM-dependent methyltransferase